MDETNAVRVDGLDDKGRGVARVNGKATFIEGALPGEMVTIDIVEDKKRFAIARTQHILASSSQRVTPPCAVYERCGGCQLQHLAVDEQRNYKQSQWLSQLQRLGQVAPTEVLTPLIGAPWHYRNRARLSVAYDNQQVALGFKASKSHDIVNIDECVVLSEALTQLLPAIQALLRALPSYRIKEVALHEGDNAIAIALQVEGNSGAQQTDFRTLQEAFHKIFPTELPPVAADQLSNGQYRKPIHLWLKQSAGKYVAVSPSAPMLQYDLPYQVARELPGQSTDQSTDQPTDQLSGPLASPFPSPFPSQGLSIAYTPNDFTQINHAMNREMVRLAVQAMAPQPGERMADLFCGLGNFSLPLASLGAEVVSVEGVSAMVARLKQQATALGLASRIQAIQQDLFRITPARIKQWGKLDKWLLDPPRAGAKALMQALPDKARPQTIVYVSCNPATLARDAQLLLAKGYEFSSGRMIDLFPQTAHIESLNVFERK